MKVKELIKQLSEYPSDMEVYCRGNFDGDWKADESHIEEGKHRNYVVIG